MGFKIKKDYMADGIIITNDLSGRTTPDYKGGKHYFVIMDDDGNRLYTGWSDELFDESPLDWAGSWAGATRIAYRVNKQWVE